MSRPNHLRNCIHSILANTYRNFEIIIVDQSKSPETRKIIRTMKDARIRYVHTMKPGTSRALNIAARIARGKIYVFTDDDCIVPKTWLKRIWEAYRRHPEVVGVSGQTLPYVSSRSKSSAVCPVVYRSAVERRVFRLGPIVHSVESGFGKGNNMSFRREVFGHVGGFLEWLGPGTLTVAGGNETEFIYRVARRFPLYFDPRIIVYHDRWVSPGQLDRLNIDKIRGYTAFVMYSYFRYREKSLLFGVGKYFFDFRFIAGRIGKDFMRGHIRSALRQAVRLFRVLRSYLQGIGIGMMHAITGLPRS